ncbi:DUF3883 domain-containing protein [Dinghuibacter silviterrae]|uniref:Uncharacterized protein DUF3883 n=1 Tax=Dinghuibacter silviterrae TaxID=1539049 RepID=A0A4V3GLR1_9BACT|nr:DUF3883 domain-containing protein [Dinghuibacter silviterrae]TDX00523.1 uncharacterized protein DUF3883 [Dinghuibacter silviterrae]
MNPFFTQALILAYKNAFNRIHGEEIYKWKAIQFFQENWDIDADNFSHMLELSLSQTQNLLASANYWPRLMINKLAQLRPEPVRELFRNLFNEDVDMTNRIKEFHAGIQAINTQTVNSYQDHRAIMVYLCLRFPERYFLYKFGMFKTFVEKSGYGYRPVKGRNENPAHFQRLCEFVREEAIRDNELIQLHQHRLPNGYYTDTTLTVLTQDIVYAAQRLNIQVDPHAGDPTIELIDLTLNPLPYTPTLIGRHINHLHNECEAKRIGAIGEQMIMKFELQRLRSWQIENLLPIQTSLIEGYGAGYDIESYNENRSRVFIEVKSTTGPFTTPFFITQPELIKSEDRPDAYRLYRLFDINESNLTGKLAIYEGSLARFCINPRIYTVILS